jgi:hypothetical protein
MLFLSERPGALDAERGLDAEALIKEARRRRRRRWIRGTAAVLLAASGAATWVLLDGPGASPRAANVTASGPTKAGTCATAVVYSSLPTWARAGFTPANTAVPHVLGAHGDIVAVLWATHDPLVVPSPAGRNNKILWVAKLPATVGSDLQIEARQLVGGAAVGPVQRRTVTGGPGPSIIDMPAAGCWQFTLRWSGHTDTLNVPYAAGS